jgi:hypothetical protein
LHTPRCCCCCCRGWAVVNSQVAPHIGTVEDPQIKFGELLGAGSFGRVYHGSWGGKEVAVKVIQHTTESEEVRTPYRGVDVIDLS